MNFKETWTKWEKEDKEYKPDYEEYQWVDRNGYVHHKTSEVWHYSIYEFIIKLKNSVLFSLYLYGIYLVFILIGYGFAALKIDFKALGILTLVIATINCYKYVWLFLKTSIGIAILFGITTLIIAIMKAL